MLSDGLVYNRVSSQDSNLVLPMPTLPQETRRNLLYLAIVFIVCMISVYDNTLNVIYGDNLLEHEENPIAKWFIEYGGVSLLVTVKAFTTLLACFLAIRVAYSRYRIALIAVLFFQLLLFCYLSFYAEGSLFNFSNRISNTPITEAIRFYCGW